MLSSGSVNEDFIFEYLSRNGAKIFAEELRKRPNFKRLLDESRVTMIIAPSDEAIQDLSQRFGESLADFLNSSEGEALLSNHLSTIPTQKFYPLFTAINGSNFGRGPQDLAELQPINNKIIGQVPVIIVNRAIFHESQYPGLTFNKLTRDPLWLILERSQPMDILNSCRTTSALARLCRDPGTFRRLMALHYPNYPINHDARQQYTDITLRNGYAYYAIIQIEDDFETALEDGSFGRNTEVRLAGRFEKDNIDAYANPENLERVEREYFDVEGHDVAIELSIIKVYGNGLDQDTQFWVPLRFYQAITIIHDSAKQAMNYLSVNKEDVAKYISDSIDIKGLIRSAINEIGVYQDVELYETDRLNQERVNQLLAEFGYPVPLTKKAIFDQLMRVNYFREHPRSGSLDEYGWALMQVTIPKTP